MGRDDSKTRLEWFAVTVCALALYLPLLCIQYDPNGIVEAASVEHGPLLNKNHMLYRPAGFLIWRAVEALGYSGNALFILQALNAVAGAIGVGFAYVALKRTTGSRAAAALGAFFLGTSFTYWVSATDVLYVTLAGMFATAALACVLSARSAVWLGAGAVLAALSVFTWQASIFLIPALLFALPKPMRTPRAAALFTGVAGAVIGLVYLAVAFSSRGWMNAGELWAWLTNYSENATLGIWGVWRLDSVPAAIVSAFDSILAVRLAAGIHEWFAPVQLGRLAVDVALVAFVTLLVLAAARTNRNALRYLAGYLCFLPFIIWWDPGSHKWFLVPNILLVVFLASSLAGWGRHAFVRLLICACVLIIAGTNFITTIRPRHFQIGADRPMAECVAGHMGPADVLLAAEWGWPDYLQYLHNRSAVNLINQSAVFTTREGLLGAAHDSINVTRSSGGNIYMVDPQNYSPDHLEWLENTTGLTRDDLAGLQGTAAFVCYGHVVNRL